MKTLSRRQQGEKRRKMFARNRKPAPSTPAGRSTGSTVPLLKNSRRFEICIWTVLTTAFGFSELEAARLAAIFDRRSLLFKYDDKTDSEKNKKRGYVGIQLIYQGGRLPHNDQNSYALHDRVQYLLKHADRTIKQADEAGQGWLAQSAVSESGRRNDSAARGTLLERVARKFERKLR